MSIETNLERFMDELAIEYNLNGTVLVGKLGEVLLKKAYGIANFEHQIPHSLQSKFVVASITKTFTGTAIMILEEEGKLKVSDPISKFLPDYPEGDNITLHHLLTHTSGIYSFGQSRGEKANEIAYVPGRTY